MNTQMLTEFLKRVPQWLLVGLVLFAVFWFGGLSYVAFFTNRSVEFFPPKVGPDPQLLAEFRRMSTAVDGLSKERLEQVTFLRKKLAEERGHIASARTYMSLGYYDHKDNAAKYEAEIQKVEQRYSEEFAAVKTAMDGLERKLK